MSHIPLYATAIHNAIKSCDLDQLKAIAEEAESFLDKHGDVSAALEELRTQIAHLEPDDTPHILYGVPIHEARQSGNLERMKAMAAHAEDWLSKTGDVEAALKALEGEIARLKAG